MCTDRHSTAEESEKKEAERVFKDINEAYEVLSDATKRRRYVSCLSVYALTFVLAMPWVLVAGMMRARMCKSLIRKSTRTVASTVVGCRTFFRLVLAAVGVYACDPVNVYLWYHASDVWRHGRDGRYGRLALLPRLTLVTYLACAHAALCSPVRARVLCSTDTNPKHLLRKMLVFFC